MSDSVEQLTASSISSLVGSSVLITGGAGYLGNRIARVLSGPCEVTVLDNLLTGDQEAIPDEVTFVQEDTRAVSAVTRVVSAADLVFHLAHVGGVDRSIRAPVEAHNMTAGGTITVLDAARRSDTRVVVASSAAVYGDADALPVHETDPKSPISPFGVAMLTGDRYARLYADLYDLPTVVLRYFNVYGPAKPSSSVVNAFVERAQADQPLVMYGDGTQTRDFLHVDDALQATLQAGAADVSGRAFNVGTGERCSVLDLADLVRKQVDTSSEVVHVDAHSGDIQHSQADVERAREDLGYEPTIDIREGIESVARSGSRVTT